MCECVCGGVGGGGEGSPQQPGCMRREQKGVNVVYFLLQVAIVFAFHPSHDTWSQSPHHGCPRPSTSTITKTHTHTHTHTHRQSRTQTHTMGRLLLPTSVQEASPPDWSWLKRAQIKMLARPRMSPSLTRKPHQYRPLIPDPFPLIIFINVVDNREHGQTEWCTFADFFW